jgi:hypothetical protein
MIVKSIFKTIYTCCIYYAFRQCIPIGYNSLGKTVLSSIFTTMLHLEIDTIFPKNNTATTRGHKYKIYKKHCGKNRRKYSFSQRVVAYWNALPESVIGFLSVV